MCYSVRSYIKKKKKKRRRQIFNNYYFWLRIIKADVSIYVLRQTELGIRLQIVYTYVHSHDWWCEKVFFFFGVHYIPR